MARATRGSREASDGPELPMAFLVSDGDGDDTGPSPPLKCEASRSIKASLFPPGYEAEENISSFHLIPTCHVVGTLLSKGYILVNKIDTNPVLDELTVRQGRQTLSK